MKVLLEVTVDAPVLSELAAEEADTALHQAITAVKVGERQGQFVSDHGVKVSWEAIR